MDRLTQLRGEAGGSRDSTLDTSAVPSEAYLTANESSKYFSLSEDDSSFDITPIKDVSLASTAEPEKPITGNDQLIPNLSPIPKKNDLLGGYKFDKQIEAANILSGGVDIFDDNDNSYDGDELVIDDNAEIEDKSNPEVKNAELPFQKPEEIVESAPAVGNKELDVDGKKVNAIDIGNGLYLYRKPGEEELAAVQIVADDNDQPSCKYLKVRENAEGNLEVYEEIEIEVPKEVPLKEENTKISSQAPIKDTSKVTTSNPASSIVTEGNKPQQEITPTASTSDTDPSSKVLSAEVSSETNSNRKMKKINETRKSPVIHSTPNKEGKPLTKTMVDMHLHPTKPVDKVKTIDVFTDNMKRKINETQTKYKDSSSNKHIEKSAEVLKTDIKEKDEVINDFTVSTEEQTKTLEKTKIQTDKCSDVKQPSCDVEYTLVTADTKEEGLSKENKSAKISLECEMKADDKNDDPKMPSELSSSEKDKESVDKKVQKNIMKDVDKNVTENSTMENSKEIKDNVTDFTEIKDTVSKTGIQLLILNDNSQTDINKQQEEQKSEKHKNVKKEPQINSNISNEVKSSTDTEKDIFRQTSDILSKPQAISDKSKELESKDNSESTGPKIITDTATRPQDMPDKTDKTESKDNSDPTAAKMTTDISLKPQGVSDKSNKTESKDNSDPTAAKMTTDISLKPQGVSDKSNKTESKDNSDPTAAKMTTDISLKPQSISDKSNKTESKDNSEPTALKMTTEISLNELNKNELKHDPEPSLPKGVDEKCIIVNCSGKINNNIDEIAAALQKNHETTKNVVKFTGNKIEPENTMYITPKNTEQVTISTVPNKEDTFAQNKVIHSEVSKEISVTQTKQTEHIFSIKPDELKPITQPKENQLKQDQSIPPPVKDTSHYSIIETKQFSAFKPVKTPLEADACNQSVPDKLIKEDSELQDQSNPKPIANKDNIQITKNQNILEFKPNRLPPTIPMGPQRKLELTKLPSSTMEKKSVMGTTTEIKPIIISTTGKNVISISSTTEKKPIIISSMSEKKPNLNNNAAVPFGQWTSANRQEFLNKIKEAKIPVTVSNTKPLSKPNDLNRRDVLQKIDSQRQSSNAVTKNQDMTKLNLINEAPTFKNKPASIQPNMMIRETKAPVKEELLASKNKPVVLKKDAKPQTAQSTHRPQVNSTVTSKYMDKSQDLNKNEMNNQDLIDKTVEGIINRAFATKAQDSKPNVLKDTTKTQTTYLASYKSKESKPSILDAIEMKMNELHGIPFVERPPHELPKVFNRDIKNYAKNDTGSTNRASKIPNLLPVSQIQKKDVKHDIIDLDSEEEVIEHEPITGDIELHKKTFTSKQSNTSAETTMAQIGSDSSKKESIITEKDFDKFVRRNSTTYENCLTVNLETNKNRNVVQGFVQKDVADKKKVIPETNKSPPTQKAFYQNNPTHKINITSKLVPVNEDVFNKNYQSKLQLAYQTALTTKRQMESPITIIEDKPVKVLFMDTNTNFQASQLNVQGPDLSPSKKTVIDKEPDTITVSTGDSLDSDVIDTVDLKAQDDTKSNKTKHQRKQVLTPVEAPELELIVPGDLGLEASPKKKRRMDDFKLEHSPKSLVPKKSYLLGRSADSPSSVDSTLDAPKQYIEERNIIVTHKDTASAIDNLVKAAELIENQAGNFKPGTPTSDRASPATPVKRGRGRPRKYPLPDGSPSTPRSISPLKKPRLIDNKEKRSANQSASDEDTSDESIGEGIVRENWTMGKINENIVCPICNKLFRSENVVFKHVKHCPGPSPVRSDSDKRSSRRSRLSNDSKSMDSKIYDTDGDTDSVISKKSTSVVSKKNTPKKRKSKEHSSESKEEVIVIEDTPVKSKVEKSYEPKQHESRKPTKTKAQYKANTLSCEICGKTFRQLSYLVSHKLLHKKANPKNPENVTVATDKSIFSCEVCNKEFRKLHHLVQHRIIHNPTVPKLPRKSSSEQNVEYKTSKDKEPKPDDQSAAFRCEPCDKSFRKLHHLVEHRETHDGINRQKAPQTTQTTERVIQNPPPPPQCDVCKKTFRKLHHLIEHKEQHVETSSEKSDDKSVKSALSTKDIIHECSLCYMVFPNEHSLNKHSVFCQKKKRQSVKPQKRSDDDAVTAEQTESVVESEVTTTIESAIPIPTEIVNKTEPEIKTIVINETDDVKQLEVPDINDKSSILENKSIELPVVVPSNRDLETASSPPVKATEATQEKQDKLLITNDKAVVELKTPNEKSKKSPAKGGSAAKRRKSNLPLARIKEAAAVESSDDDEVLYMLNPDYKEPSPKPDVEETTSQGKLFMKVRAKKRNSLQFERPNSKDLGKRRASLQHPPKIPRLKPKVPETNDTEVFVRKPAKVEPVPCTDSDDSDVKYSFPVKVEKSAETEKTPRKRKSVSEKTPKNAEDEKMPEEKRKSLADKRKSLSGIARRKSMGKPVAVKHKEKSPVKEIKRRRGEVEHRCDCGQLFSSAALLARHTSLAHTPPRVRRRRVESPPPLAAVAKPSAGKPTDTRKSSARSEPETVPPPKAKPGRPPGKKNTPTRKSIKLEQTALQSSRKSVAHRGVPVPEKMKKIIDKLK
ncbi:hypothetical protein O0L34_g4544 [Tuta absoluta]|nr:hypothetical protein O0L34_g4544 [Tuta absoluta]